MFYDLVKKDIEEVEKIIYEIIPENPSEVYSLLPGFIKRGGKRIRPTLALISAKAINGKNDNVLKTAALIEIFHNFTLIHDDIEDNSQMRRGEPTLNVKYGIPIALNCGDALYTLLWKEATELTNDPKKTNELQKMMSTAFLKVVEGQGIELEWYRKNKLDVTENEYYSMVEGKTGALVALSCEVGAYLSGADARTCKNFKDFGNRIGVAFQVQDDVLNVSGNFEKYKKEIGGDITEGKRTLMIAKVFEKADQEEKDKIKKILLSKTDSQKEINYVIDTMKKYGAVEYAREKAKKITEEAKNSIKDIKESDAKKALYEVADFVIDREV